MKVGKGEWTRREFLAASAAAGAGAMLLGPHVALGGQTPMKMDEALGAHFGVDMATALRVAERMVARGADLGELYFEDTIRTGLIMEDGKLRDVTYQEDTGAGLRAVLGDSQAYGYTQLLEPRELEKVAGRVAAVADKPGDEERVIVGKQLKYAGGLYTGEGASVRIPAADKLALLQRADAAARKYSPLIRRVDLQLTEELRIIGLVSTLGDMFIDYQPMLSLRVTTYAEKGALKQRGYVGGGGRMGLDYFDRVSPEKIAIRSAAIAVGMLEAKPAPAGEQTVVLAPGDSGILLHEAVGHGLEADFNRKGTSKYSGKVGEKVASPLCTVIDDGTIPRSRGSINVDDEGSLSSHNVLIEKGILRDNMHDWVSSRHYKLNRSGNGRRQSYRHPPYPRMTNTYMLAGESDPEEIIGSTKKGIYCKTFSGGQVNISNGDFVFQVIESYLIEEGKLTAPLKDVVIIGNGPDALAKVSMAGTDLEHSDGRWTCGKAGQMVPVGVGIPTVKIDGITVGGTA